MLFSKIERRLAARLLVLSLLASAAGAAILAGVWRPGGPSGTVLLTAVAAASVAVALIALAVVRRLGRAVEEMRLGAELIATVNPTFRLRVGGDELAELADEINRMADRLGEARAGLEREVRRATQELRVERGKLSTVLEALGDGVVVATPEGRVALANHAALAMLGAGPGGLLGRSLFDLVDQEKIAHFFERLQGVEHGVERFTLHPPGGAVLAAAMTPFFDDDGRSTGFVLVCRDVTRLARLEEERRPLLAQAVQELRGPLSSIRSLSESLLGETTLVPLAGRLVEAIHTEAVRLSALVRQMGEPTALGLAAPPGHFETLSFSDLAAITIRRLQEDGHVSVEVEADEGAPEPSGFRGEVSALSWALAHLLRATMRSGSPEGRAWLRSHRRGQVLLIDAGAEGESTLAVLEAFLDAPLPLVRAGQATVREIVRKHAGEVWAYEDSGRIGFRVTLPTAEPGEPPAVPGAGRVLGFMGAGTASGFAVSGPGTQRPDFYDFSLFEEMERHVLPADRERALAEIRYVVFDLETTGLHPEAGDRIVSLAGVRVRDGALRRGEAFDALVNPRRPVPASSVRFHGITDAMVAEAPPIDVVLPAFLRFAESSVLVGHQVWFDVLFLAREAARLGLPPLTLTYPILDTLTLSQLVHGSLPDHGLDATAQRLGVVVHGRHSALGDALTTAEVLVRLLSLLQKRGIVALGQALTAVRALQVSTTDDVITPGSGP